MADPTADMVAALLGERPRSVVRADRGDPMEWLRAHQGARPPGYSEADRGPLDHSLAALMGAFGGGAAPIPGDMLGQVPMRHVYPGVSFDERFGAAAPPLGLPRR